MLFFILIYISSNKTFPRIVYCRRTIALQGNFVTFRCALLSEKALLDACYFNHESAKRKTLFASPSV